MPRIRSLIAAAALVLAGCAATSPTRLPQHPAAQSFVVDGQTVWVVPHPSQPKQWIAQLDDWFSSTLMVDTAKSVRQLSWMRRAVEQRAGCPVTDVSYPLGAEQLLAITSC